MQYFYLKINNVHIVVSVPLLGNGSNYFSFSHCGFVMPTGPSGCTNMTKCDLGSLKDETMWEHLPRQKAVRMHACIVCVFMNSC